MNRAQLRLEVRRLLNEATANFFTDAEIHDWLNEGAVTMTAISQHLQSVYTFSPSLMTGSTTQYNQDYVMPDDCDEVYGVSYYHGGSLLDLTRLQSHTSYEVVPSTSTPTGFYTRAFTGQRITQLTTGLDVRNVSAFDPRQRYLVIGLVPIPNDATDICNVFYLAKHARMETDADVPILPMEYQRGIIYFAAARGSEKDNAMTEANKYDEKFAQYAEKLKDKTISEGQEISFPRVHMDDDDECVGFQVGWGTD